jgi:hypothetical protein
VNSKISRSSEDRFLVLYKHSGDQVKKTEMGRTCGAYGERRGAYRALVGKPEGRRPLGRPRRRWGIILKWIFERLAVGAQTGLIWLRIRTGGGLLCIR